jgi:hypothetical protein
LEQGPHHVAREPRIDASIARAQHGHGGCASATAIRSRRAAAITRPVQKFTAIAHFRIAFIINVFGEGYHASGVNRELRGGASARVGESATCHGYGGTRAATYRQCADAAATTLASTPSQ